MFRNALRQLKADAFLSQEQGATGEKMTLSPKILSPETHVTGIFKLLESIAWLIASFLEAKLFEPQPPGLQELSAFSLRKYHFLNRDSNVLNGECG